MSSPFRSSHIPIAAVNVGWRTILTPNRAAAMFLRDDNRVDEHVTSFIDYTIPSQDENTPAGLSFKFYGTKDYWWFICWFNGIVFPTTQMEAGRVIKMPDKMQIESYLKRSETVFGFLATQTGVTNPTNRMSRV
jgi:hypothetical protein